MSETLEINTFGWEFANLALERINAGFRSRLMNSAEYRRRSAEAARLREKLLAGLSEKQAKLYEAAHEAECSQDSMHALNYYLQGFIDGFELACIGKGQGVTLDEIPRVASTVVVMEDNPRQELEPSAR